MAVRVQVPPSHQGTPIGGFFVAARGPFLAEGLRRGLAGPHVRSAPSARSFAL